MSKISLIHHSLAWQKLEVEDSFHRAHQVQGLCQFDRCVCAPPRVDRNSSVIFRLENLLSEWHFSQHFSETEEHRVKSTNEVFMCVTYSLQICGMPSAFQFSCWTISVGWVESLGTDVQQVYLLQVFNQLDKLCCNDEVIWCSLRWRYSPTFQSPWNSGKLAWSKS